MRFTTCFVLLQLCVLTSAQWSILDSPFPLAIYRTIRKAIFQAVGTESPEGARMLSNAKDQNKLQDRVPDSVPFPCDLKGARSARVPTSVDRLRPGDIDVIAALGDSLTAGTGILSTHLEHLLLENRGVSAGGGGQGTWREFLTLPNILKVFNPGLVGYAYGDSLTSDKSSQLSLGENAATVKEVPYMAEVLIKRIKQDPRIDFKNHWKLVVLNIGSNDFCLNICTLPDPWSILEEHKRNILKVLRLLRDNLPRTLVVLASPPHMKNLVASDPQGRSFICSLTVVVECSCIFALQYRKFLPTYYEIEDRWFEQEQEIVQNPEFHRKDFEVVSAPCLRNTTVPRLPNGKSDPSFTAADCFHISQKGNAWYANSLWNNLLEPIKKRTLEWSAPFQRFICPTKKMPYLVTRANSPE